MSHWKRTARTSPTTRAPIPLANRVYVANDAVRRGEIRRGLLYGKGPLLLAALHRELGDEAFLAFLRVVPGTPRVEVRLDEAASRPLLE